MKPFKDIDSIHQTLILKTLCVIFPLVTFLGWVLYGLVGILYTGIICAIVAFLSVFISDGKIFNSKGAFHGFAGPPRNRTLLLTKCSK